MDNNINYNIKYEFVKYATLIFGMTFLLFDLFSHNNIWFHLAIIIPLAFYIVQLFRNKYKLSMTYLVYMGGTLSSTYGMVIKSNVNITYAYANVVLFIIFTLGWWYLWLQELKVKDITQKKLNQFLG